MITIYLGALLTSKLLIITSYDSSYIRLEQHCLQVILYRHRAGEAQKQTHVEKHVVFRIPFAVIAIEPNV